MSKTMNTGAAVESMTFTTRVKSRGDAEVGPCDLEYTETVCADGSVIALVVGYSDGERVNQIAHRPSNTPVRDWAAIERARVSQGWRVVAA